LSTKFIVIFAEMSRKTRHVTYCAENLITWRNCELELFFYLLYSLPRMFVRTFLMSHERKVGEPRQIELLRVYSGVSANFLRRRWKSFLRSTWVFSFARPLAV